MVRAIKQKYKPSYPQKLANENGRLYGMFSDFLDFVRAGKQADSLVDYLNTRYRTDVKNEFDKKWQPDKQSKPEALKSNAKVLLKSCRDKAGSTADPEIQAVKINTLKMLRGLCPRTSCLKSGTESTSGPAGRPAGTTRTTVARFT